MAKRLLLRRSWVALLRGSLTVEKVKALLGFRALGREVIQGAEGREIRGAPTCYKALFGAKKGDIGMKNTYF